MFVLGIGTGILIWSLTVKKNEIPLIPKPDPVQVVSSYSPQEASASLNSILGPELSRLLLSTEFPKAQLEKLRLEIEDGKLDHENLSLSLKILAAKWPDRLMEFIDTVNPKVANALRLKSLALNKMAERHADITIKLLSESGLDDFEGRELYDIGLQFFKNETFSAGRLSKLVPELSDAVKQAEAESILRKQGVAGLVSWISGLKSSTLKTFDAQGKLLFEKSNTTSFALDRLSQFLKETSSVQANQLFSQLASPAFADNSIELSGAFRVLAEINPAKALDIASSLRGEHSFAAERGAFMIASKSSPEIALQHLSKTTDKSKQNLMLTLLEAYTDDPQIRSECQALLATRGLPISQNK